MTDPKDARLAWALLKTKQSAISKALKKLEPHIDQEPGDKNAAKVGAAKVGSVAMTDPDTKATVTDLVLFTKFVTEVRPDEVEDVPTVSATFIKALLQEMDRKGELLDWEGHEVPGVAFAVSQTPYQRFYPDDGAIDLLGVLEPEDLPDIDGVDLAGLLGVRRGEPLPGGDVA